jgi:CheY-like chemotaxis protein
MVLSKKGVVKDTPSGSELVTRHTISEARKGNVRILVVEDNIVNQKVALSILEKYGFKAEAVANGKEGIRALEMVPYDIVLMDVQMPVMDGMEATRLIRSPKAKVINHDIPIIALTAHAMKGDQARCLEAGMDGYLAKPIKANEMIETIEKYLFEADENSIRLDVNKDN